MAAESEPPRSSGRDEWLQIRTGTPISKDIWRAIFNMVAFIALPVLAFALLGFTPWEGILVILAGLSLVSWPVLIVGAILLTLLRIARGVERMGR